MTDSRSAPDAGHAPEAPATRRDFLFLATGAFGVVGTAAAIVPLIAQMEPDASTIAAGGPIDVDLKPVAPGQMIIVRWRSRPIFIVNRPQKLLATFANAAARRSSIRSKLAGICSSRPMRRTGIARSNPNLGFSSASARISAASRSSFPIRARPRRRPHGPAAISVPVTARNTTWRAGSSKAFRRLIICRFRRITSSTTRRCGSAKIRPAAASISIRSSSSDDRDASRRRRAHFASAASCIFTILSGLVTIPFSSLLPFLILSTTSMPETT